MTMRGSMLIPFDPNPESFWQHCLNYLQQYVEAEYFENAPYKSVLWGTIINMSIWVITISILSLFFSGWWWLLFIFLVIWLLGAAGLLVYFAAKRTVYG